METLSGWHAVVRDATGYAKGRENVGTVFTTCGSWSGRMSWHGDAVCVFTTDRAIVWLKTDNVVAIELPAVGGPPQ